MQYCNRCFRNIFEDVKVCPYCKKADKLVDYDKEKRGEDFSCNNESTLSSHINKDDAYNIGEKNADTVYGNTGRRHNLDNCENSADTPQTQNNQKTLSAAYLQSLPPEQRRKLIEEKKEELRRRYGVNPSADSTYGAKMNVNGKEVLVDDFIGMMKKEQSTLNDPFAANPEDANLKGLKIAAVVAAFINPFFAIVVSSVGLAKFPKAKNFFVGTIVWSFIIFIIYAFALNS
ncbi:MAG: hypothetical protein IJR45_07935 [Firmicutes bacterium]|nr:hypothetical protein [Bacillota bacterium]